MKFANAHFKNAGNDESDLVNFFSNKQKNN